MNFNDTRTLLLAIFAAFSFTACTKNSQHNELTVNKDSTGTNENRTTVRKDLTKTEFAPESVDDQLAEKLKIFINNQFLTVADKQTISDDQRKFQFYKIDLNNDGKKEIFVNFPTTFFCGSGGCTMLLLNDDFKIITKFSPIQNIYVKSNSVNDWKVLMTQADGSWKHLIYDSGKYPSNPSVLETTFELPNRLTVQLFGEETSRSKVYQF